MSVKSREAGEDDRSVGELKPVNLLATGSVAADRRCLVTAAIIASLGGFLFGYDNIVISGAILYLGQRFQLTAVGIGWAAGCALVGCIAGSAGAGIIVDRIGLRKGLTLCAVCFAVSSMGILFADSFS